jgi:hypothetical protein
LRDFNAFKTANEITDMVETFGKPRHIEIAADHAYVVVPASFTYKMNGKPMKESGSVITVALQKGPSGWRTTGWAYSEGTVVAVKTESAK